MALRLTSSRKSAPSAKQRKVTERFVLMVGEEGAIFVHLKNHAAVARHFTPSVDAPETASIADIASRFPNVPILLVFDTLDQTYLTQTLPPVSALSVKKLMERRLNREFSKEYLKGALLRGRNTGPRKDWNFTMAAIERSGLVAQWLKLVLEWPNPCPGIYLLPMESASVINQLNTLFNPNADGDIWPLLVSYNKVSGLRQVACHNGELVLTRLGHLTMDSTAETIAGTIEQEVIGTKEYLRRLVAEEDQDVDVYIIAPEEVRRAIDPTRLSVRRVYLMTPHEVATALKLQNATQSGDRFGDAAMAAAIGLQPKFILPIVTPELKHLQQLYQAFTLQKILAGILALGMLFMAASSLWNAFNFYQDSNKLEITRTQQQTSLKDLQAKAAEAPDNIDKIINVMTLYQKLLADSYNAEPLLARISELLPSMLRAKDVSWQMDKNGATGNTSAPAKTPGPAPTNAPGNDARVTVQLTLVLPGTLAQDKKMLQQITIDTLNGLKGALPEYDISYTSLPEILNEARPLEIVMASGNNTNKVAAPLEARIQLKGPWKPKDAAPAKPEPSSPKAEVILTAPVADAKGENHAAP